MQAAIDSAMPPAAVRAPIARRPWGAPIAAVPAIVGALLAAVLSRAAAWLQ